MSDLEWLMCKLKDMVLQHTRQTSSFLTWILKEGRTREEDTRQTKTENLRKHETLKLAVQERTHARPIAYKTCAKRQKEFKKFNKTWNIKIGRTREDTSQTSSLLNRSETPKSSKIEENMKH